MHQQLQFCPKLVLEEMFCDLFPSIRSARCSPSSINSLIQMPFGLALNFWDEICTVAKLQVRENYRSSIQGLLSQDSLASLSKAITNPRWPAMISREKWKWWRCQWWLDNESSKPALQLGNFTSHRSCDGEVTPPEKVTCLEKEKHLPNLSYCVPCKFSGVYYDLKILVCKYRHSSWYALTGNKFCKRYAGIVMFPKPSHYIKRLVSGAARIPKVNNECW